MSRLAAVVAVALAALAATAMGQDVASLQQALDRPVNISIPDAPIGEVFSRLTAATGVKFVLDPDTLESLPYGDQTRLAVTLKNVTLRNALTPMLSPQALQWAVDGGAVRVLPSEGLYRMCRRATYDELKTLGIMYSDKFQPSTEAGSVVDQLRKATGNKQLDVLFHVEADKQALLAKADRALPGTAVAWLDAICQGKNWTWYLWGDDIIILDRVKQVQRQLQRQVSVRPQGAKLMSVLLDLAHKAHVELSLEPGVMNYLPVETVNNFNLMMADASIGQALEVISGATGLKFTTTADGIRVEASDKLTGGSSQATQPARKRASFLVRMMVAGPNGAPIEVLIRSDDLPPDLADYIQGEKDKYVDKLKTEWQKKHPTTTSAPAEGAFEGQ